MSAKHWVSTRNVYTNNSCKYLKVITFYKKLQATSKPKIIFNLLNYQIDGASIKIRFKRSLWHHNYKFQPNLKLRLVNFGYEEFAGIFF